MAPDAVEKDFFGSSVAVNGETVVVGAILADGAAGFGQGSAYVFVRSGGVWSLQQKLVAADGAGGDVFGRSVAISNETIVVGADLDDGAAGSAYVFVRSGGVWTQQQKLEAPDAQAGDIFGMGMSISGETLVVGVLGQLASYVFVRSAGHWNLQQKLEASDPGLFDGFGYSWRSAERPS